MRTFTKSLVTLLLLFVAGSISAQSLKVLNPNGAESGFKSLTVNGKALEDNYIPADILQDENEVILQMS